MRNVRERTFQNGLEIAIELELAVVIQNHRPLHEVFQFPDVAGQSYWRSRSAESGSMPEIGGNPKRRVALSIKCRASGSRSCSRSRSGGTEMVNTIQAVIEIIAERAPRAALVQISVVAAMIRTSTGMEVVLPTRSTTWF